MTSDRAPRLPVPPWPDRPTVRANMIVSLDGSVTGPDGRSGSLGCPADRALLADLRASADVVLAGRSTVTLESYGPVRVPDPSYRRPSQDPVARLAIVTASGDVPQDLPAFRDPRRPPLVVTTAGGAQQLAWLDQEAIVAEGEDSIDLAAAIRRLSAIGRGRILCEGGPRLLGSLLAAGLVDEMCLTLAPATVSDGPRLATGSFAPASWTLAGARAVDSFLFLHYRRAFDA